jgi:hypothetical protein
VRLVAAQERRKAGEGGDGGGHGREHQSTGFAAFTAFRRAQAGLLSAAQTLRRTWTNDFSCSRIAAFLLRQRM